MCRPYSSFWNRHGLTLIEVMASLALLSTLLVGMLLAFKKNATQIRAGLAVREVLTSVDALVLSWAQQGVYPPVQATGALPGRDGFIWRTRVISREWEATLHLDIIALEVRAVEAPTSAAPLITLELPVPAAVPALDSPAEQAP